MLVKTLERKSELFKSNVSSTIIQPNRCHLELDDLITAIGRRAMYCSFEATCLVAHKIHQKGPDWSCVKLRDLQDLLASEIHLFHLCWHPRSQNLHLCFTFSIKAAAKLLVLSSSCRLEKDHCMYMVGMLTRSDEGLLKVSLISSLNQAWLGYLHVGQWSTLALQSWQRMWPV